MAIRSGAVGGLSRYGLATALIGGPFVVRVATRVDEIAEQTLRATQYPQPLAPGVIFSWRVGDSFPAPTFTRAGDATFVADIPDAIFSYAVGRSLADATFARAGDATFTGDV